ncbi:MAG: selenide, water dikinase SelD [Ginsengibacter sp.]
MDVALAKEVEETEIKLTQYSHGAGCGCKISPLVLDKILKGNLVVPNNEKLIVGNSTKDDAAVYDLENGMALISTTDFFMPIVDDPFEFGRIASANAISDVYAMGGKPILAIAILGWPINLIPPEVAQKVIDGSRSICIEAGISLAGGHSIDSPEPIFGLAVNGLVPVKNVKQNNNAKEGDLLFLTKPLGVGILTTAVKKQLLKKEHDGLAAKQMMQLNSIGELLGTVEAVHAMTDVTGFGLLGHLTEMAEGSELSAEIYFGNVQTVIPDLEYYVEKRCIPGGTERNWDSYGKRIGKITAYQKTVLADPQTSGGLLIAVDPNRLKEFEEIMAIKGMEKFLTPIGKFHSKNSHLITVTN